MFSKIAKLTKGGTLQNAAGSQDKAPVLTSRECRECGAALCPRDPPSPERADRQQQGRLVGALSVEAEWARTGCCCSGRSPASVPTLQLSLPSPCSLLSSNWAGKMSTEGYQDDWAWHLTFHLYEVCFHECGGLQLAWHFTGWLCTPTVHVSKKKVSCASKVITSFFPMFVRNLSISQAIFEGERTKTSLL